MAPVARRVLPVIVFSQFADTSLWFAANAVMSDLHGRHLDVCGASRDWAFDVYGFLARAARAQVPSTSPSG